MFGDLELVHALGRAGIPCVAVSPRDSKVRLSRYVRDVIDGPPTHSIEPGDQALVERLVAYAERAPDKPVVFCDSDEALRFLSHNRPALERVMRVALPDHELVIDVIDKMRFQAVAEHLDLPVPRSRIVISDLEDPPEGDAQVRFPAVLKPVPHRNARWRELAGAQKALCVGSRGELEGLYPSLRDAGIDFVIQELVPGGEDHVVSYHVYVGSDGNVMGEFTGRKIRTFPLQRGMSTALTTTDDPEVAELGRELVGRIGLRGVAKLDFKRDETGALHLLEVNPRFTLWVHAGAVAGVNLPALAYADLTGAPRPASVHARPGVRWVSLQDDRAAARAAGIPFARWAAWALASETNSAFAWSDPGPLLRRLVRVRRRGSRPVAAA